MTQIRVVEVTIPGTQGPAGVAGAAGTGFSDGDKGDITISGSGTVLTIDNDVVTYAKIQNVSATSRILGRIASGAGDIEELTAANVRTVAGLVIGTDVQAFDAELSALAGLTSAADKLPYFTGSGTATVADFTAAGRALVDDATAAAQRTTLGVGTTDSPQFASVRTIGTGGLGFSEYVAQSSPPSAPASGYRDYADATGRRSWIRASDGFSRTWDATLTASRVYTLQDASGTIYISGGTDVPITDGGTGASTAAAAVTNLGLDNTKIASVGITIDGGGSAITTGIKGYIEVPYACTINRVTLLADVSGSIVIDVWKDTFANYPPTVADTIVASAKPTLSAAAKSQDSTLTGWTTSVAAGDVLGFKVDSAATVTRVHLILKVTKT